MTNSPQDPDQTAPMDRVNWPEPGTRDATEDATRQFAAARGQDGEAAVTAQPSATGVQEKKGKKPFTSRKLTLILGAVVFFLAGTFAGIGLNIAFGNAGGDSSQMSPGGGPGGSDQMPGGGSGGQATAGSGSGSGANGGSNGGANGGSGSK